jgi:hypothetical protein
MDSPRPYTPSPHEFSDDESNELLKDLYCYCEYYDTKSDSIAELAAELAQSQDHTSAHSDEMRRALETRFEAAP